MTRIRIFMLFILFLLSSGVNSMMYAGPVECYEYAPGICLSSKYEVCAAGSNITVIQTAEPDIAIFGASGPIKVKVKCLQGAPDSIFVRPLAKKYKYSLKGNVLTVTLRPGDRVSIEPNGSQEKPLFIFVNNPKAEEAASAAKDPNTIFFEKGKIHHPGKISLSQGKTVYIEGGAIVEGYIDHKDRCSNVTIAGAGILDARPFARPKAKNAIKIADVDSLKVRDITVLNSDLWTTYYIRCDHSDFQNIHVVATASNNKYANENDGFNIVGCQHVRIKGCFSYAHDDAYCIKTSPWEIFRESFDVIYEDCVAWNICSGNSFEIGYAVRADVYDVHYKNLYAIHSGARPYRFRRAGIAIHNGGGGHIHDIFYENVFIEDPLENILSINVFKTPYKTVDWFPGRISNISIKNLRCWKYAPCGSEIKGFDADHLTSDVEIDGFYIGGRKVENLKDADIRETEYSKNIILK